MRLINSQTHKLEHFMENKIPKYAILSHTWGEKEVTFQEMEAQAKTTSSGLRDEKVASANIQQFQTGLSGCENSYAKINKTCERAREENIPYVWVDTCCIDKSSSAELSEAINSMMRWYEQSEVCYAYLEDVPALSNDSESELNISAFSKSRWFTRGWTLQELVAPKKLAFLAKDWSFLFYREGQSLIIGYITGISTSFLQLRDSYFGEGHTLRASLAGVSFAERMSWASNREASRPEDVAYSLLGIFGVNMPLLYGEGSGAFFRLQEELIKHSDDQSLLAWSPNGISSSNASSWCGIFAESPSDFAQCGDYVTCSIGKLAPPFSMTNKGLSMEVPLVKQQDGFLLAILECRTKKDPPVLLAVPVDHVRENLYARVRAPIRSVDHQTWAKSLPTQIYLLSGDVIIHEAIPDFTVILGEVPQQLHLKDVKSLYLPSRRTNSKLLMQGNKFDCFKEEAKAIAWMQHEQDDSLTKFVLIVRLERTHSLVDSLRAGSPGVELEPQFELSCYLQQLKEGTRFFEDEDFFRIESAYQKYWEELGKSFLKGTVPYSPCISVEKNFFGKSLFSIDIVLENSSYYPISAFAVVKVGNPTTHDLEGARFTAYTSNLAEQRLRGRWFTSLKAWYAQIIWKLGYIVFGLRLFPRLFTFLVDLVIDRVLPSQFGVFGQMLLASLFVTYSKQSPWSPLEFIWEWISRNWEDWLMRTVVAAGILYICCKYIPAFVLSLALSEGLEYLFDISLMPRIV